MKQKEAGIGSNFLKIGRCMGTFRTKVQFLQQKI